MQALLHWPTAAYAVYSVHRTPYVRCSVYGTTYTVRRTVYIMYRCTMYGVQCTPYTPVTKHILVLLRYIVHTSLRTRVIFQCFYCTVRSTETYSFLALLSRQPHATSSHPTTPSTRWLRGTCLVLTPTD